MTEIPRPPANIDPFVRVLGAELAFEFLMQFGGAELYLAPTPKGGSEVEALIGADLVARLAALGLPRRVPTAKPWLAQYLKTQSGLSHAKIARRLHTTDVTVRAYLRQYQDELSGKPSSDPRQPSFF